MKVERRIDIHLGTALHPKLNRVTPLFGPKRSPQTITEIRRKFAAGDTLKEADVKKFKSVTNWKSEEVCFGKPCGNCDFSIVAIRFSAS